MLDLGPFHNKVLKHIERIINNPDLLLAENTSSETRALNSLLWQSPEVFHTISQLKPQLLHLKPLLVQFLEGAATTWTWFTSEFAPGGLIDESTANEKDLAWMPATNDANESALGSFQVLMHNQPQLTVLYYNAQWMFEQNDTQGFISEKLTKTEDLKFIHREAQAL